MDGMGNFNSWYQEDIKKGKITLFAEEEGNWNLYIDKNNRLYAIAKTESCRSTMYGDIRHFLNIALNFNSDIIKVVSTYKDAIEGILNKYAAPAELAKYKKVIKYI